MELTQAGNQVTLYEVDVATVIVKQTSEIAATKPPVNVWADGTDVFVRPWKNDFVFSNRAAFLFNTPRQTFFSIKSACDVFFVSFIRFYQQTFLATFYLILLRLSMQILTLEIQSFKRLRYTYECNNW